MITLGTLAGAIIPEVTKAFTSTSSRHVREVVTASREGGASLNVLSGLTAGNFSAFWVGGVAIVGLMAAAYWVSLSFPGGVMVAPAVFAFGLVAFGFLGMGPVTIAVDSYGPVTDNAQSVYELSLIEQQADINDELQPRLRLRARFRPGQAPPRRERRRGQHLQGDGQAGSDRNGGRRRDDDDLLDRRAARRREVDATTGRVTGLDPARRWRTSRSSTLRSCSACCSGPPMIYWFTGASTQAVITGAYRAVAFIKRTMRLDGLARASLEDSKRVVAICTRYAQAGMFNIFLTIFFMTLGAAFVDPYFFVGYLIGLAISGLYQAIFMANAGGAWDNAKKIVETELHEKGTALHSATVVGDTVGDPFKDTSSVALNPIIKFATLFGLLAVELALETPLVWKVLLAVASFAVALTFVYRSFYGMRIEATEPAGSDSEVEELVEVS